MNNKIILNELKKGHLVILPSDTVYGIHADATSVNAIKKVDEVKHSNKPHIILVSSIKMLKDYILEINDIQRKLIDKYWPGPLTILFKKNNKINDELTKNSPYVGVRLPNNDFLIKLINEFKKPLLSTSANISNMKTNIDVLNIEKEIKENVSFIYDTGKLNNEASTLVKVENNKIIILREGILTKQIKEDFKDYI